VFRLLLARDLAIVRGRAGSAALPVVFFLVAIVFPFAVSPEARTLARVGARAVWASPARCT